MAQSQIETLKTIFLTRLETIEHILEIAENHYGDEFESILQLRLFEDMLPFGTQVVYTCNQPRNFSLWCEDLPTENLGPEVETMVGLSTIIYDTKTRINRIDVADEKLNEIKRIELGRGLYMEVSGSDYVNEFLMPNFYFHMVTAYDILRKEGVPLGKQNFMHFLLPKVKHD